MEMPRKTHNSMIIRIKQRRLSLYFSQDRRRYIAINGGADGSGQRVLNTLKICCNLLFLRWKMSDLAQWPAKQKRPPNGKKWQSDPLYGKKWQCLCGLFSKRSSKHFKRFPFPDTNHFSWISLPSVTIYYHNGISILKTTCT